jgi:hypothetical protein
MMLRKIISIVAALVLFVASLPAFGQSRFCPDPSTSAPCVAITASSGNAGAGAGTATLAAVIGKTTYISGFEITGGGATTGACTTATITGTITGTLTYTLCQPTGAAVGSPPLVVSFAPAIPASAVNTTIVVTITGAAGTTNMTTVAHGYQL